MPNEAGKFSTKDVTFNYAESKEISSTRKNRPIITGIKSLHVTCKECNHDWISREYGDGKFLPAMNQIHIECPSCKASESIAVNKLM